MKKIFFIYVLPILLSIAVLFPLSIWSSKTQEKQTDSKVLGKQITLLRGQAKSLDKLAVPVITNSFDVSKITAKSILSYDPETGTVLVSKDPDSKLPIASVTKLMTGLIAYETLDFSKAYTVAEDDVVSTRPSLGLLAGEQVFPEDLLAAMLIGSCNDAAKSLAGMVSRETGSDFVQLMNEKSKKLNMVNTNFENPIGFDSESNYSTASDLKLLIAYEKQFTAFEYTSKQESYSFTSLSGLNHKTKATNKLIKTDREIYAVKTGFTDEAQGTMITKVMHEGHEFVIIVLGSEDREADTLELKSQILNNVRWP